MSTFDFHLCSDRPCLRHFLFHRALFLCLFLYIFLQFPLLLLDAPIFRILHLFVRPCLYALSFDFIWFSRLCQQFLSSPFSIYFLFFVFFFLPPFNFFFFLGCFYNSTLAFTRINHHFFSLSLYALPISSCCFSSYFPHPHHSSLLICLLLFFCLLLISLSFLVATHILLSTCLFIILFRFLFLLITPTFFIFYLLVSIPDFCLLRFIFSLQLSPLSLFFICQFAHFSVSSLVSSCDLSFSSNYSCLSYFSFTFLPLLLLSLFLSSDYSYFCCILFICPSLSLISLWFVFFTKPASTFAIFHFNGIFHSNYFYPRNFLFTCPFLCLYSFFYRLPLIPFFPAAPSSTICFHLLLFSICL